MKFSQYPQPAGVHHACVARGPPPDISLIIWCPQGFCTRPRSLAALQLLGALGRYFISEF
eukprot:680547-Prymnesium_polylepis.1